MLNNDIFGIFYYVIFGIFRNNAYLCIVKLKVKLRTPAATGNSGTTIMAKYTINHTCGHQVTVQLFGKYADRERRIAYLETCECDECRKAKANAAAAAAKEERGLPDLTGSEKQIAWANTIREQAYKTLDCLTPYTDKEQVKTIVDGWREKMNAQTQAKWWIDNRFNMPKPLVNSKTGSTDAYVARCIVSDFRNLFDK